jgi:formylglycine-generating enzyme
MLIYKKTSTLAVRHVLDHGARMLGHLADATVGDWARNAAESVQDHFTDHSEKLTEALARSNERAWKTIEIALGGQRLWDRFASAEDHALREQVKAFLTSAVKEDDPGYLTACLKELRQAREKGHLTATDGFHPESLAEEVGPFARFDDPEALLAAECNVVEEIARELQRLGYRHLGRLLSVTPTRGQPLLAMAAQYYFRRAVEEDQVLARGLSWIKLIAIDRHIEEGFAFLALIQERHGRMLEEILDGQARMEVVVVEMNSRTIDIHATVHQILNRLNLPPRELSPGHSYSCRDDRERRIVADVLRRYRDLGEDQRRRFPQLLLDVSRLEIGLGDYAMADSDAAAAAPLLERPSDQAVAHHTRYMAALEERQWDKALQSLRDAVALDPDLAPWPPHGFEIERILGAGGFGVAFLARKPHLKGHVVFKTFKPEGIDQEVDEVFREAEILENLHDERYRPGIVRLFECGFADPDRKRRPYLKLEYFKDSLSLADHIHQHGPLSLDDLLPIAIQTAEALEAAHQAGVLHRDVKPGNLLVRKTARGWEVKVIDFGLSLRRSLVQTAQAQAAGHGRSMIGSSIAGSRDYAAPEQLDPARSKDVGTHSDVFGFGRMCLFALFKTSQPRSGAIRSLPEPWPELLDDCCDTEIGSRPKDFSIVLERLRSIPEPREKVETPPPVAPQAPAPVSPSPVPPVSAPAVKATPKAAPSPRFTNTLGMILVRIERGEFLMGSTKAQVDKLVKLFPGTKPEWFDGEQPQHRVKITRPFYLAAHQVTVGQFRRFIEKSGYKTEAEKASEKQNWRAPGFAQGDDHPVVYVSHNDALAFLGWLNQQESEKKRGYRLPTEAEWEYACRAGTRGLYGGNDNPKRLLRIANIGGVDDGFQHTAPVGSFAPNAWQLYDMIGNVWEWCDDWYDPEFYQRSPIENPHNSAGSSYRVFRGGDFTDVPRSCRPAHRSRFAPSSGYFTFGFRVAAVQE